MAPRTQHQAPNTWYPVPDNTTSLQHNSLKLMTIIELHKKIDQAEKDIKEENVYTQDQVEEIFSKKNKS